MGRLRCKWGHVCEAAYDTAAQLRGRLPPGVDGWGVSLRGLMSMVVIGGFIVAATYYFLQRTVVPGVVAKLPPKPKKHKAEMGIGESFTFLAKSTYIRDLAALVRVCCCGPPNLLGCCAAGSPSFVECSPGWVQLMHA